MAQARKPTKQLWSMSTTVRNPERIVPFLETASKVDGEPWNLPTQRNYQILLIQDRHFAPQQPNLTDEMEALIKDPSRDMTFGEAEEIFYSKQYESPAMRGRTSLSPLRKMGLVTLDRSAPGDPIVRVTPLGKSLLDGTADFGDVVFRYLLKAQVPSVIGKGRKGIKPFIGILHLIKRVNALWAALGHEPVGITKEELGVFGLSLEDASGIVAAAEALVAYRRDLRAYKDDVERKAFVSRFIASYLDGYREPGKNASEYADNIIRYLRLSRYVYIRGGGYYVDLEPRRMVEIDALLAADDGSARSFANEREYEEYIADPASYALPFETVDHLRAIANGIITELHTLARELGANELKVDLPETVDALNTLITRLRARRVELSSRLVRLRYAEAGKIGEAIAYLRALTPRKAPDGLRPSIALEKWAAIALNILDDAKKIKPNCPLGDDNEPIFTAPANVPDIECAYDGFNSVCEVTMLVDGKQWVNEGQPVMRHLREFEDRHSRALNYCLFIAPRIHEDTSNTFWYAVKNEYRGLRQKIVPITINQLASVLEAVKARKEAGKPFTHKHLLSLYDSCVDVDGLGSSDEWVGHVRNAVVGWCAWLKTAG